MSDTPAQSKSVKPEVDNVFFSSKDDAGPKIHIQINENPKDKAPIFIGTINDKKAAGYIRNGTNGPFIAFVGDRDKDGKFPQLATGNIIVNRHAKIRLSWSLTGSKDRFWANVSDKASNDLLVSCGLRLDILASKQEAMKSGAATA